MKTHQFNSTGDAYDACQCDESISTGDVLVIESERVAGVAHTWPFAVTLEAGHLHHLAPGYTAEGISAACGIGATEARRIAVERGWSLATSLSRDSSIRPYADSESDQDTDL